MKRNFSETKTVSMQQVELVVMITMYSLDYASGLKQVLDDGPKTYTYGNGCLAQISNTDTEYFLATRWAICAK